MKKNSNDAESERRGPERFRRRLDELFRKFVDRVAEEFDAEELDRGRKGALDVVARTEVGETGFFLVLGPAERPVDLSRRERQVIELVAEGLQNKSIAQRLGIKPATVAAHMRRIFAKLEVSTRTELVQQRFLLS